MNLSTACKSLTKDHVFLSKESDKKDFTVTTGTDDKERCSAGAKKDSKDEEQRVEETRGDSEGNKENEDLGESDKNTITLPPPKKRKSLTLCWNHLK